ncbi:hypothetical protein Hanom_Chr13g01184161 [Helianthus anomalus]
MLAVGPESTRGQNLSRLTRFIIIIIFLLFTEAEAETPARNPNYSSCLRDSDVETLQD